MFWEGRVAALRTDGDGQVDSESPLLNLFLLLCLLMLHLEYYILYRSWDFRRDVHLSEVLYFTAEIISGPKDKSYEECNQAVLLSSDL